MKNLIDWLEEFMLRIRDLSAPNPGWEEEAMKSINMLAEQGLLNIRNYRMRYFKGII